MPDRVHHHPNLIYSLGTQVVTLVDVLGQNGKVLHSRGSVGVVVRTPTDLDHPYRVRFADGVEESLNRDQLTMLAQYKESEIGDTDITAIGIDEISVGPGHDYRIVVSDLIRGRPIWFGGEDRSEKSLDGFFVWFGPENCRKIRIAVMDMWKPFRASTLRKGNAPRALIVYDKFHVLRHLGDAMDKVRRAEYAPDESLQSSVRRRRPPDLTR